MMARTLSGLSFEKPACAISALAAGTSYFTSKLGLPNQGLLGGTMPLADTIMPPISDFMPSRSMARLAALRTRMSFHGEPSRREKCQGQTWGYTLLAMAKPAPLRLSSASGGGASTQSTWLERSAATRADGSGTGSSTSLSSLGTRFLFQ